MAVSDAQLDKLRVSPQFVGRVRSAVVNYAVYLYNINATGNKANWSSEVRTQSVALENWVQRMVPFVLINVAAGSDVSGSGDTLDITAADSAIRGEVENKLNAVLG